MRINSDLVSGKLNENLFKCGSGNCELFDPLVVYQLHQHGKDATEATNGGRVNGLCHVVCRSKEAFVILYGLFLGEEGQVLLELLIQLLFCDQMLHGDGVALAVVGLQVARASVAHEATIDHDDDVIAKRLSFVHSVSCQNHRSVSEVF